MKTEGGGNVRVVWERCSEDSLSGGDKDGARLHRVEIQTQTSHLASNATKYLSN